MRRSSRALLTLVGAALLAALGAQDSRPISHPRAGWTMRIGLTSDVQLDPTPSPLVVVHHKWGNTMQCSAIRGEHALGLGTTMVNGKVAGLPKLWFYHKFPLA